MSARIVPGIAKSINSTSFRYTEIGTRRRRRALAAFLTGGALFVTSAVAMISQGASARGPGLAFYSNLSAALSDYRPSVAHFDAPGDSAPAPHKRKHYSASVASASRHFSSRLPVCVRLCDGFFFPASEPVGMNDQAGEEASCSSLCPDAPTALYYQQTGSDKIEDAISPSGAPYTALPVALRYRSTNDNTCTCHRDIASQFNPLNDSTLRKGDALMTASGFLVFHGDERAAHSPRDFSNLASTSLPKEQRTTLQAMERVSVLTSGGVSKSWVASAASPPRPVASRQTAANTIHFVDPPVAATN